MNKTLVATSIALSLGITAPSVNAAFTALDAGAYTMSITGGCFTFGNCQVNGFGTFTDNTASQAAFTVTANVATTRAVGSTVGSGTVGGTNGTIDFSIDAGGNMTVTSYAQDSYINTCCGTFFFDALGTSGTSAMTGSIDGSGNVNFTPTGRETLANAFATSWGVQEWNRDSQSGLYDTFTTGSSTNRNRGGILNPSFTMTGTALSDNGLGGWTGVLVSAGNVNGSNFTGLNEVQYSEVWEISITASAVPIPAAVWLFGSGLLGLIGVARRKKHND